MIIAIWTKLKLIISQRCKDDYEVTSQKSILNKWSLYTPWKYWIFWTCAPRCKYWEI